MSQDSQPMERKINIVVPNLDSVGFGKDGSLTRTQWQQECVTMLLAGRDAFNSWQQELDWIVRRNPPRRASFYLAVENADKTTTPLTPWGLRPPPSPFVLDLTNQTFPHPLLLRGYVFKTEALFAGCTFTGGLICEDSTVFEKDASFLGCTSPMGISCSGTPFRGDAIFDDAVFGQAVIFSRAKFAGEARFRRVEFQAEANFGGATFNTALFEEARFAGKAWFSGDSSLNENKLQTFGAISFSGAHFGDRADFSNREFADRTSFGPFDGHPTVFARVPLFHNCELHQDTTFEEAKFPQPSSNDETDARAYNALRFAMSKHEFVPAQRLFMKLELEAQGAIIKDRWERGFHCLYKFFSDYGLSIRKPFLRLLLYPMLLALPLYGLVERWSNCASPLPNYSCRWDGELAAKTVEFAVLQSLTPLGFERISHDLRQDMLGEPGKSKSHEEEDRSANEGPKSAYPGSIFTLLVVLQKILSLTGLFLIGLALRNLFRIK